MVLKEHNTFDVSNLIAGFKRNARNKYVNNNKSLMDKNRDNKRSFAKNIDYYVSTIMDDPFLFLNKIMPKRCEEKVAVEQMYRALIPKYIERTEIRAYRYKKMLPTLKNPSYSRRKMEHLYDWAEMVRGRYVDEIEGKIQWQR